METNKKLSKEERIQIRNVRAVRLKATTMEEFSLALPNNNYAAGNNNASINGISSGSPSHASMRHSVPSTSRLSTRNAMLAANNYLNTTVTESEIAIENARKSILGSASKSINVVERLRLEVEKNERTRRLNDEQHFKNLISKKNEQKKKTDEENAQLENKWEGMLIMDAKKQESVSSQQMYENIASLFRLSSELLNSKQQFLESLQNENQHKEENFIILLNTHSNEIHSISQAMRSNFRDFQSQCREELNKLEEDFLAERSKLLETHNTALENFFQKRKYFEISELDSNLSRMKKQQIEIEQMTQNDHEDFFALKIELENSIETFEYQLEKMKKFYFLNSEKLFYNYEILLERNGENKKSVEYLRLKTRYLKEKLQLNIQKCHGNEVKLMEENKYLSKTYLKNGNELQNLQKKFLHFIQYETVKYNEISTMNMKICLTQLKKLYFADKIINERILGWNWINPFANRIKNRRGHMKAIDNGKKSSKKNSLSGKFAEETKENEHTEENEIDSSRVSTILGNIKLPQTMLFERTLLLSEGNNENENENCIVPTTDDEIFAITCADLHGYMAETRKKELKHESTEEDAGNTTVSDTELNTKINQFDEAREIDSGIWNFLGNPVNEKLSFIWDRLENDLQAYYKVLHKRQNDVDEVFELSEQNSKLRQCLRNYGVLLPE